MNSRESLRRYFKGQTESKTKLLGPLFPGAIDALCAVVQAAIMTAEIVQLFSRPAVEIIMTALRSMSGNTRAVIDCSHGSVWRKKRVTAETKLSHTSLNSMASSRRGWHFICLCGVFALCFNVTRAA